MSGLEEGTVAGVERVEREEREEGVTTPPAPALRGRWEFGTG